jgi:hypothetical protein
LNGIDSHLFFLLQFKLIELWNIEKPSISAFFEIYCIVTPFTRQIKCAYVLLITNYIHFYKYNVMVLLANQALIIVKN